MFSIFFSRQMKMPLGLILANILQFINIHCPCLQAPKHRVFSTAQ